MHYKHQDKTDIYLQKISTHFNNFVSTKNATALKVIIYRFITLNGYSSKDRAWGKWEQEKSTIQKNKG